MVAAHRACEGFTYEVRLPGWESWTPLRYNSFFPVIIGSIYIYIGTIHFSSFFVAGDCLIMIFRRVQGFCFVFCIEGIKIVCFL